MFRLTGFVETAGASMSSAQIVTISFRLRLSKSIASSLVAWAIFACSSTLRTNRPFPKSGSVQAASKIPLSFPQASSVSFRPFFLAIRLAMSQSSSVL